jgi:DNA-3-methyladenine glycosylase
LVHETTDGKTSGLITETEAYIGIDDPACHTFQGRNSERVRSMYLDGGHAYVYLIYGMHWCFNVVTMDQNSPEAVLIRAVRPLEGIDLMFHRRHLADTKNLTDGPGKLCEAFGINRSCDGLDLTMGQLYIQAAPRYVSDEEVEVTGRIGITSSGDAAHWPLRFLLLDRTSD